MNKNKYDIIGDIHGYGYELEALFRKLGYSPVDGVWRHQDRRMIFLGDFIDRGPQIRRTLQVVRAMVDNGSARAVMGNHEFNALCYHTRVDGAYLREHSPKNEFQHGETLKEFRNRGEEWADHLKWFKTLPLYLDLGDLRIVHAAWDNEMTGRLPGDRLTDELLPRAARKGTFEYDAVEVLLKGIEIELPEGVFLTDKEGVHRSAIRTKWWLSADGHSYRDLAFPFSEKLPNLPVPPNDARRSPGYPGSAPPVFIGHYWLDDSKPKLQASNVACLDYSVSKGGFICAYRWDGEQQLDQNKFVWCM